MTLARRMLVGGTYLVVLTAFAACSDNSTDPGSDGPATPKPSLTHSPMSSPTSTQTGPSGPTTGGTSTSPTATPDPSLVADLLSAQRMPGLNSETSWAESATYSGEGPEFSTLCQLHPWRSIGSIAVVRRDYAGPAGSTASSVLAKFATGKNARRANAVWTAWAHECEATAAAAGHEHPRINDEAYTVHTAAGQGRWWLLTYGPVEGDPDAGYFEAFGLVRHGDRLTLVRMTSVGQDYNYEPGQEPVAEALRRAGQLLVS